jgi:zinc protease
MINRAPVMTLMLIPVIAAVITGCAGLRGGEQSGRALPVQDIKSFLAEGDWEKGTLVDFPEPTELLLPNGLRVIVVERHDIPMIYARAQIRGGSIYDPPEKSGLAYLTGWILTQGTETYTKDMIDRVMDSHGAYVSSEAYNESCIVTLTCLSRDIETLFPYFAEIFSKPSFETDVVEENRMYLIGDLMRSMDDAGEQSDRVFRDEVFRGHPYQKQMNGTMEGFRAIKDEDVRQFYRDYYSPDNAVLVIVGDIETDTVVELAEKHLGEWQVSDVPLPIIGTPDSTEGLRVLLVDRPATQAQIRVGHVGINRTNPDRFKITVMNKILGGGGLYTRLAEEIRVKRGLTYGIYSSFARREYTGEFMVSTFTRAEMAVKTIQVILDEIRRIQTELVSEKELEDAKMALTGSHPLRFEEYEDIAQTLVHNTFYGLPMTDVTHFAKKISTVTIEDVKQAAQRYLQPDDMVIVVTGPAEQLQLALEEIGPVVLVQPI